MSPPIKNPFVWRRAVAISKKEIFHIMRDPFTLGTALVLPVFMVMMFGIAIEFNVKNIPLAVSDSDHSQSSRKLVETFGSSQYFIPHSTPSSEGAIRHVTTEAARAALIIPPHFGSDLVPEKKAKAQLLIDGSDNTAVGPVFSYIASIQSIASKKIGNFEVPGIYELRTRFLFNPELNSRWFVIPGLNVIIMAMLSILLTALTVAREWENGSMELLLSTPVQPIEIIIGKLAPYGALGVIAVLLVFVIARLVFEVPFVGNPLVYALGASIFLIAYLAQGLLISVVTRKQQVAMQVAMISGMLPSQLLSGFIFPIESMPPFFQYVTMALPARWFMHISRSTFLKGSSLLELSTSFLVLSLICLAMIIQSTRKFKRDLEP